jgi:hypothetical protein
MTKIFKYSLTGPTTILSMPSGAQVLSVGVQGADIVLWAQVDPEPVTRYDRKFNAINTGDEVPSGTPDRPEYAEYIGTVSVPAFVNGVVVWHIFEMV